MNQERIFGIGANEDATRRSTAKFGDGLGAMTPMTLTTSLAGAPTVTERLRDALVGRSDDLSTLSKKLARTDYSTGGGGRSQSRAIDAEEALKLRNTLFGNIGATAEALRAQQILTTQVTVTDMCRPDVEGPGSLMLFFRGIRRLLIKLSAEAPIRNDIINELETAFMVLNRVCGVPVVGTNGINNFETSLISLNVLAASGAAYYRDNCDVEGLRTFVLASCKDSRLAEKLGNLDAMLRAAVESRNFPHSILFPAGALTESISSTNVACVKMLMNGSMELESGPSKPCASFRFPACLYLDLDDTRQYGAVPVGAQPGIFYVYLLFLYTTEPGHPGYEVYVAKSVLGESALSYLLDETFARRRVNNTVAAAALVRQALPQIRVPTDGAHRFESAYARACGNNAVNPLEQGARPTDLVLSFAGVPDRESATYAAFCQLGFSLGPSTPCYNTIHRHGIGLKYVEMPGLTIKLGTWRVCY